MRYTEPRYTKDLDLWVEPGPENAFRVFRALAAFGAPLTGLSLAHEGFFYQIGVPPVRVDLLMSISGLQFADAWPNRNPSMIGGQNVWFIGRADLVRNKRASGRHIDLHDAELLE